MAELVELGTSHVRSSRQPREGRIPVFAAVLTLHIAVALALGHKPRYEVGVVGEGPVRGGIAAFIDPGSGPVGTSGPVQEPRKVTLVKSVPTPQRPQTEQTGQAGQGGGSAASSAGDGAGGPVRYGSGLVAISKVNPIYPAIMERARQEGFVMLDAIIHRDGTVGEIKVLQSSGPAFEQSAITAVSQWRYTPMPQEGILTVRVNFNLLR